MCFFIDASFSYFLYSVYSLILYVFLDFSFFYLYIGLYLLFILIIFLVCVICFCMFLFMECQTLLFSYTCPYQTLPFPCSLVPRPICGGSCVESFPGDLFVIFKFIYFSLFLFNGTHIGLLVWKLSLGI